MKTPGFVSRRFFTSFADIGDCLSVLCRVNSPRTLAKPNAISKRIVDLELLTPGQLLDTGPRMDVVPGAQFGVEIMDARHTNGYHV